MTIDQEQDFYTALASATGYDFELMNLARKRTEALFNVQIKNAYMPELEEPGGWKAVGGSTGEKVQG